MLLKLILLLLVLFFVTLGKPWLESIQSSRRGRPKIATGGLLLPQATPLLLPHATRLEAPPPSRQEEASSDDLVEMWVVAPPPLRLQVAPPPLTCLVAPPPPPLPLTHVEESFDDFPSDSLGYNDECPHVKEVSSYELLHFNCLVQLLNVQVHFQIQKLEKVSCSRERTAAG
jgi:hypothetical protein